MPDRASRAHVNPFAARWERHRASAAVGADPQRNGIGVPMEHGSIGAGNAANDLCNGFPVNAGLRAVGRQHGGRQRLSGHSAGSCAGCRGTAPAHEGAAPARAARCGLRS
jgi:hypothetical protein